VALPSREFAPQTIAGRGRAARQWAAISMLGSDSQGMGRVNEASPVTWAAASKDEGPARPPAGGKVPDRRTIERIKRTSASPNPQLPRWTFGYTFCYIGSLEDEGEECGPNMRCVVLWRPGFFGIKPELVVRPQRRPCRASMPALLTARRWGYEVSPTRLAQHKALSARIAAGSQHETPRFTPSVPREADMKLDALMMPKEARRATALMSAILPSSSEPRCKRSIPKVSRH